jgi:hypothetical protein
MSKFKVGDRVILRRSGWSIGAVHGEVLRETLGRKNMWDVEGPSGVYYCCTPSTLTLECPVIELSRAME